MIMAKVVWQDHYSEYGWHEPENVSATGHINVSCGILVEKNDEHLTLAQTMHKDESMYADLLHILVKDIVTLTEVI
jgi:hypothetical protein